MVYSVLVVFVLLSGIVVFSAEVRPIEPYDYWDDAEALLQELQTQVSRAQTTSQSQTGPLINQLATYGRNVSASARSQIDEGSATVLRQIANLDILAGVLGLPHCTEDREEELKTVSEDLVADIDECIAHVRLESTAIIINVSAFIAHANEQVNSLRRRLADCPRETGDEQCIIILIGEIQLATYELPDYILMETLRMLLMASDWEKDITTCSDHRIGLIFSEGSRIIFEIEACLTAPPTTSTTTTEEPTTTTTPTTTSTTTPSTTTTEEPSTTTPSPPITTTTTGGTTSPETVTPTLTTDSGTTTTSQLPVTVQ